MSLGGSAEMAHLRRAVAQIEGADLERAARRLPLARALDPALGGGLADDALHEIAPAEPADGAAATGFHARARRALPKATAIGRAVRRRRLCGARDGRALRAGPRRARAPLKPPRLRNPTPRRPSGRWRRRSNAARRRTEENEPELLLALPEHKVHLAGSALGASQNDLFALTRVGPRTIAVTIEGKVDEPFDELLSEWLAKASHRKHARLAYLCEVLGLEEHALPLDLYYQLLHRTASAVIEAERFKTDAAAMLVHSFSPTNRWFDAFAHFASLFGCKAEPDKLIAVRPNVLRPLYLGWARGDAQFLTV